MKKLLSAVLCLVLLLSLAAPILSSCGDKDPEDTTAPTTTAPVTPPAEPQDPYEEMKACYAAVIDGYTALLTAKKNGEPLTAPTLKGANAAPIAEALLGIVSAATNPETRGYGYRDIDGNGTPELLLTGNSVAILAILSLSEGEPILLTSNYDQGDILRFVEKNRILITGSSIKENIEEAYYYTCHVEGDRLVYDMGCGQGYDREAGESTGFFRLEDGARTPIDQETFGFLIREHRHLPMGRYDVVHKLYAPLTVLPLKSPPSEAGLPVADFSSYAAILSTCRAIDACISEFERYEWLTGGYDRLLSFPSDTAYEYYMQLMYAMHHYALSVGYDELDLNGDGRDELVLLNEDYTIKAIFTEREGTPVLVAAFGTESVWLDAAGKLHVDREEYDELEYSLYEFTESGTLLPVYSLLLDNNGRYITRGGETEPIGFEESMTLYYDEYCQYSEPFSRNEHTRNVSALSYAPLTPRNTDPVAAALGKTWKKYADLDKTTGQIAHANTYLSLTADSPTEVSIAARYVFFYYYPDPERENYMLEGTTETTAAFTVEKENGVFYLTGEGIRGRLELLSEHLWLIIEESTDERFPVGAHCYRLLNEGEE